MTVLLLTVKIHVKELRLIYKTIDLSFLRGISGLQIFNTIILSDTNTLIIFLERKGLVLIQILLFKINYPLWAFVFYVYKREAELS